MDNERDLALEAKILEFKELWKSKDFSNQDIANGVLENGSRWDYWEARSVACIWLDLNDDDNNNEQQQQLKRFQQKGVNDGDLTMVKGYKNSALLKRVKIAEKTMLWRVMKLENV